MLPGHLCNPLSSSSASQGPPRSRARRSSQETSSSTWLARPCRASRGSKPGTSSRPCPMGLSRSSSGGKAIRPRGPQGWETRRQAQSCSEALILRVTAAPRPDRGQQRCASWCRCPGPDLPGSHPAGTRSRKERAESHRGGPYRRCTESVKKILWCYK